MSKTADTNLWDIHDGKSGDADSLFLGKNCIAVGWTKMGDLSALKPDRDAFKARVAEVYPEKSLRGNAHPTVVPSSAGTQTNARLGIACKLQIKMRYV